MGLEERKGKTYYYKKKRLGHRVVSEYAGSGPLAILEKRRDKERAAAAVAARKLTSQEIEDIVKLESKIDCISRCVETLSSSELVLAGYHQHKGEWRRRRNERSATKERKRKSYSDRDK